MQETITVIDCDKIIAPECYRVFNLGVKMIEKEFGVVIDCDIKIIAEHNQAVLTLISADACEWYKDIRKRETIIYKLSTHFKICMEQF